MFDQETKRQVAWQIFLALLSSGKYHGKEGDALKVATVLATAWLQHAEEI